MSDPAREVVKGAAEDRGRDTALEEKRDLRPSFDQLYLAARINELHGSTSREPRRGPVSIALLQRWNLKYGPTAVSDALRLFHGFPPAQAVTSPVGYLHAILRKGVR